MTNLDELIAEARHLAQIASIFGDSGVVGTVTRLADALEAATRERAAEPDAATEERIDRWMQLVGKGVEERMDAEAERDAALAAVKALHRKNLPEDGNCQGYGSMPGGYGYLDDWCVECSEQSGREYGTDWPCATYRAIEATLGGEGDD